MEDCILFLQSLLSKRCRKSLHRHDCVCTLIWIYCITFSEFQSFRLEVVAELERLSRVWDLQDEFEGKDQMAVTGEIAKSTLHRCQQSIPPCSILAGKPSPGPYIVPTLQYSIHPSSLCCRLAEVRRHRTCPHVARSAMSSAGLAIESPQGSCKRTSMQQQQTEATEGVAQENQH